MKKIFLTGLLAAALCMGSMVTVLAEEFEGGPGYTGIQEGYRDSDGSHKNQENTSTQTDSFQTYADPYFGSIPQPPKKEDMADYALPFQVVLTTSGGGVWSSTEADAAPWEFFPAGEMFRFIEESGDYYKVLYDGHDAYLPKSCGTVTGTIRMDAGLETRSQVVLNAFQNLGGKYTYGGSNASTGFDCSGFIQSAMASVKVSLPRTTKEQVKSGTAIDVSQIRPGDLMYYGETEDTVNHGAIYIGNGLLIHSHSTGTGVRVQSYNYKGVAPFRIVNVIGDRN